jgi:hypothetical protein
MARGDVDVDVSSSVGAQRSLVQRMDALQRANEIRVRRAELKRAIKAGRVALADVLLSPPDYAETAKVFDLLLAAPRFGRVRANKLLVQARISPSKTVGGLSSRQREELVRLIAPEALTSEGARESVTDLDRFAEEVGRLVPAREVDGAALERAARAAAADPAWEATLGRLLSRDQLVAHLQLDAEQFATLLDSGDLISLTDRGGATRFPEFQFVDGIPSRALTAAHRVLVRDGHVSPWSAAAWLMSPHPDLDGRSPAQWASERRDDTRLLSTARRDAARLAH